MTAPDPTWHRVGRLDQIPPLGARVVGVAGRSIAIFRTSSDGVFALLDRCPHRGGPLSQGIVHGGCVTCPLHDWVIDLATGEAKGPDEGATERFPVRIDGDEVMLGVPVEAARRAGPNRSGRAPETARCVDSSARSPEDPRVALLR